MQDVESAKDEMEGNTHEFRVSHYLGSPSSFFKVALTE
jgi:hypothetical protein